MSVTAAEPLSVLELEDLLGDDPCCEVHHEDGSRCGDQAEVCAELGVEHEKSCDCVPQFIVWLCGQHLREAMDDGLTCNYCDATLHVIRLV